MSSLEIHRRRHFALQLHNTAAYMLPALYFLKVLDVHRLNIIFRVHVVWNERCWSCLPDVVGMTSAALAVS